MKSALFAILVLAISTTGASAFEAQLPVARQLYTCAGTGLSRVAFRPQAAPCCTGMLGCPQLLANTGLVKPKHDNRT